MTLVLPIHAECQGDAGIKIDIRWHSKCTHAQVNVYNIVPVLALYYSAYIVVLPV